MYILLSFLLQVCAQSNAAIDELVGRFARDGVWQTNGKSRCVIFQQRRGKDLDDVGLPSLLALL